MKWKVQTLQTYFDRYKLGHGGRPIINTSCRVLQVICERFVVWIALLCSLYPAIATPGDRGVMTHHPRRVDGSGTGVSGSMLTMSTLSKSLSGVYLLDIIYINVNHTCAYSQTILHTIKYYIRVLSMHMCMQCMRYYYRWWVYSLILLSGYISSSSSLYSVGLSCADPPVPAVVPCSSRSSNEW